MSIHNHKLYVDNHSMRMSQPNNKGTRGCLDVSTSAHASSVDYEDPSKFIYLNRVSSSWPTWFKYTNLGNHWRCTLCI